jgi:hypothetical protein
MRLALILLFLTLCGCLTHGPELQDPPSDFQAQTLDYRRATESADSMTADIIVLAYPVVRKIIREVAITTISDAPPSSFQETETTLAVLSVFKGADLPNQIRFRQYQEDHRYRGLPQGPSGKMGDRGIFFLRRQSTGMFRSVVDVYRADIPTPWIREASDEGACTNALAECISRFLLTFKPGYNQSSFLAELSHNVRVSLLLIGYLNTFDLLNKLVDEADSDEVEQGACIQLSESYALFPARCRVLMTGVPKYRDSTVHFREGLRQGGMAWVQERLHTKDPAETLRYLQLLSRSSDDETRRMAKRLLNSQKAIN